MIIDKECIVFREPILIGFKVPFERFGEILEYELSELNLDFELERDTFKSGGFLDSFKTDCWVIYNSNHKYDYFKVVIFFIHDGNCSTLYSRFHGRSSLAREQHINNHFKKQYDDIGGFVGRMGSRAYSKKNVEKENKFLIETSFYSRISDAIDNSFKDK